MIGAVGIIAAGAFALVRQGEPAGDASETNKGAPRVDSGSRRLALPAKTLEVQGYFVSLAAGDGKAVPLIYQPKSCTKALVWDAVREKVTRVQPWPKCSTARARAVRLAAGWDSYRFSGAIARNLLTLAVRWNISDSCGGILNRVVFPHRTGETLGTYLSGCLYVGEFESSETAVGGFARGGRAVYYNVWRARAGQGRRVTMANPEVWRLLPKGRSKRVKGWQGVLVDAEGDTLLVRRTRHLLFVGSARRPADEGRTILADTGVLTGSSLVAQTGSTVHVHDTATGKVLETRSVQVDPFKTPKDPYFPRQPAPAPYLLDASGDLVAYASGRRIRLLRLSDGFDAIIAEHPYDPRAYEFPALDAALDDTGLFYAVSWMPQSDDMWPYGEGRVMFVSAEALEAGLPSG